MDETCLLWKDPPPSPPEYNVKTQTEKLTLITCTNMDATHKLSLNILGRYQEPIDAVPPESPKTPTTQPVTVNLKPPPAPQAVDNEAPLVLPPKVNEEALKPEVVGESVAGVGEVKTVIANGGTNEQPPLFCDATTQSNDVNEAEVSAVACNSLKIQSATTKTEVVSPGPNDVTVPKSDVNMLQTDVNNSPPPVLLYRKGETHELTPDIFTDWFYSTFVPQVRESLAARDLPQKAVLIVDNSLYHPEHLICNEGQIKTVKIPCYVANRSLPSATISRSLKARYRTQLAKGWMEDKDFCRNLSLRRFL